MSVFDDPFGHVERTICTTNTLFFGNHRSHIPQRQTVVKIHKSFASDPTALNLIRTQGESAEGVENRVKNTKAGYEEAGAHRVRVHRSQRGEGIAELNLRATDWNKEGFQSKSNTSTLNTRIQTLFVQFVPRSPRAINSCIPS